ncbi:unnamed protein product [Sphagnum jensenii]|uniref:Uncharacterized protein n=1 Tax=Sphagnum jensenii TaxID=128206 RepID=A0ABP1A085_9BRYO
MYFGGVCYFINGTGDLGESNFDKLIKTGAFADGAKWYKAVILIRKGKKDDAKALLKNLFSYDNYFKDRALKQ